ncbi:MAG TPA: hypothetical protein VJW76_13560 [Verrucomicrobiae bacterium]|nr:hypothetical protein [Verrucomicrobiae bacterium]
MHQRSVAVFVSRIEDRRILQGGRDPFGVSLPNLRKQRAALIIEDRFSSRFLIRDGDDRGGDEKATRG